MPKTTPSVLSGALFLPALLGTTLLVAGFLPPFWSVLVILGSLRLHLALAVLLVAVLLLLLRRRMTGLAFGLIALAVLAHVAWVLVPNTAPFAVSSGGTTIKVMSFNAQGGNRENGERIADYIEAENPDIAFIQEGQPLRPFLNRLRKTYPFQIGCGIIAWRCDSLLLSRFRLGTPDYYLQKAQVPTRFYVTTITVANRKVALSGVHLTKAEKGSLQAVEFAGAAERIAGIKTPVIVAGDFNTAPWSPRFAGFLAASGLGRLAFEPATWPTGFGIFDRFGLPIDHILVRGLAFSGLSAFPDSLGSNHRGLMAELVLPTE